MRRGFYYAAALHARLMGQSGARHTAVVRAEPPHLGLLGRWAGGCAALLGQSPEKRQVFLVGLKIYRKRRRSCPVRPLKLALSRLPDVGGGGARLTGERRS